MSKSSVEEIRARFDNDVERFSNLETGQSATIDSPLGLDLVTEAAARVTPHATAVLDIGCGAGNYTLKLLERLPDLAVTLIDLSRPMLDRAAARIGRPVETLQGDIRDLDIGVNRFDIAMGAAVFHHLRTDEEWRAVFGKVYAALRPGGSFWIFDLVEHTDRGIQTMMWRRYGEYLAGLKDEDYRDHVFAYIEREDTPRPLMYQLDVLRSVGFRSVDVLHKNGPFAAFGGVK